MSGTVDDISDSQLLRRAVTATRRDRAGKLQPRWVAVMDVFGLGSTYARQLCVRYGLNPEYTGAPMEEELPPPPQEPTK